MQYMPKVLIVSGAMVLLSVELSRADLIAYEGFQYATGSLANGNGGIGFNGGWYQSDSLPAGPATLQISATSLPVPQSSFEPAGGSASKIGGTGFGVRQLAHPFSLASDADYYISLLLRLDATPTSRDVSLEFFDGSTDNVLNEVFRVGTDSSEYQFKMIGATGVAGPTSSGVGGDAHIGATYLVVVKIEAHAATDDQAFLATYPGLENGVTPEEPSTWTQLTPGNPIWSGNQSIDRLRIVGGAEFTVDELRIGTTWVDVTGPVPVLDYAAFAACLTGPVVGLPSGCSGFDFDVDSDVDLRDFASFQITFE